MDKGKKVKKILKICSNVLLGIFLAVCVFSVIVTIISKNDVDGAAEVFGYQMRIVTSESMAKCDDTDVSGYEIGSIPLRSMVFIEVEPDDEAEAEAWYADIKVGDVLTFKYTYSQQVVITHRVVDIEEKEGGGYIIQLEGDNKSGDQNLLRQTIDTTKQSSATNYVIGKVKGQSYVLGVILSTMQEPIGIILIVIVPCLFIIAFELIRIIRTVNGDKKEKEREEKEKKDEEIEELKRRLAELEGAQEKSDAPSNTEANSEEMKE